MLNIIIYFPSPDSFSDRNLWVMLCHLWVPYTGAV